MSLDYINNMRSGKQGCNMKISSELRTRNRIDRGFTAKSRMYLFPKGENILENLQNRRSRPYKAYREMLPEIFEQLKLPHDTKVSWSQLAGCRCGCSPGFIFKERHGFDVFVKIEG